MIKKIQSSKLQDCFALFIGIWTMLWLELNSSWKEISVINNHWESSPAQETNPNKGVNHVYSDMNEATVN